MCGELTRPGSSKTAIKINNLLEDTALRVHFPHKQTIAIVVGFTGRLVGLLPTLMILHGREMPRDPRRLVRSVSACFPPRPGKALGVGASYRDALDVAGGFAAASRSRCYRSAILGFRKPARRVLCPASRGPPGASLAHDVLKDRQILRICPIQAAVALMEKHVGSIAVVVPGRPNVHPVAALVRLPILEHFHRDAHVRQETAHSRRQIRVDRLGCA